jgi:hypothetical protein
VHGKGRFLKEIESVTIDLSNTCVGSGGRIGGHGGIEKNFTSEMSLLFPKEAGAIGLWTTQQRTTLGLAMPLVAFRVSTTN